ncbi:MAG: trypsin-like serine protease [Gammaproteobacteria bacterium]|nr:trypsin-like serine protease [Gammaproteobacteria bacterium]
MRSTFKSLFLTLLLISVLGSASAKDVSSNAKAADTSAIIGGAAALLSTYPWIAYLAYDTGEQYCGASLISPTWILTAAHCFLNEAGDEIDIETGAMSTVFLNTDTTSPPATEAIEAAIGQIIVHPNYQPNFDTSPNSNDFDIALVEITAAVDLQPVSLLAADAPTIDAGIEAIIMGWGATAVDEDNESIDPSDMLLQAKQSIVDNSTCLDIYFDGITDNMICAGGSTATPTVDTCQGDSGGPLSIASGDSFVQVGIVSFGGIGGPACGDPESPGVYSSVSALASFIQEHATDATFTTLAPNAGTPAPVLAIVVDGKAVTISWSKVPGATGYILYYAPFPSQAPVGSLDVGPLVTLSGTLEVGTSLYVAVQPYNTAGMIDVFSNVEIFTIE